MIPTQRSGQVVRLLVLGTGDEGRALKARAVEAGAELAQRLSSRVTHVVVDDTVGEQDNRLARARSAGLPVLGVMDGVKLVDTLSAQVTAPQEAEEAERGGGYHAGQRNGRGVAASSEAARGSATRARAKAGARVADAVGTDGSSHEAADHVDAASTGPADGADSSALENVLVFPPLPEAHQGTNDEGAEPSSTPGPGAVADVCDGGDLGVVEPQSALADRPVTGLSSPECDDDGRTAGDAEPEVDVSVEVSDSALQNTTTEIIEAADVGQSQLTATDATHAPEATRAEVTATPYGVPGQFVGYASSLAWALVPMVSIGLLTPVSFGYAALRSRSRVLAVATVFYAVCAVCVVYSVAPRGTEMRTAVEYLRIMCLAASWLGGTAHSFLIRRRVFG